MLALCVVTAAACGARSDPNAPSPARTAVEGLQGRICHYVTPHGSMPGFAEITRIGTAGNLALWGRDLTDADSVELSVRYGEDGRVQWVYAIGGTLEPDRTQPLERLLRDALEEEAEPDWGVRIQMVGNRVASVEPSVLCEAERVQGSQLQAATPVGAGVARALNQARGRRFPVRVSLDERGRVLDVRLSRRAPNQIVERYVLAFVRNSAYEPKLHDGIGVATVFEFQVRFSRR